jgi:DNA polymerase-3 subunit epsilon
MLDFLKKVLLGQHPIAEKFKHVRYPELPLLSLDLELTSLDTSIARITSIGWLTGSNYQVDLASAEYNIIRAKGDLQQSPVIHGLTAKDIKQGAHIRERLQILESYVESHVWVLHNAALDMQVLNRLWKDLGLKQVKITTIDTMLLEVYVLEKAHGLVPKGAVVLDNARKRYGLAATPLHNALDDALATLTLLYAQLYALNKRGSFKMTDLAHTGAVNTYILG